MGSSSPSRRLLTLLIAAALAALAGWRFLHGQPAGLPVDDAYIHLVYAQNLAQGLGWCFNAGEPSLGTSSPLWVFLIRCLLPFFQPEAAVRVLAMGALILSAVLLADLAFLIIPSQGWPSHWSRLALACSAALFFVFSGNLLWIAFCGMESLVFLMLGLLAIRGMVSGKPGALTGFCLALIILTRIEGAILYFLILGWWLWRLSKMEQARGLASTLWFLIAPLAWAAWTAYIWRRFDLFLPSTMAGKLASNLFNAGLSWRGPLLFYWRHMVYLVKWDYEVSGMILFFFSSFVFFGRSRPHAAWISDADKEKALLLFLILGWGMANFLLHAFLFRSTAAITPYHCLRYQVLIFPSLALSVVWSLSFLRRTVAYSIRRKIFHSLVSFILAYPFLFSFYQWQEIRKNHVNHLQLSHQAAALWAKIHLPKDARIAGFDIGSLKFFSGRYVIDLGGLTDPAVWPYLHDRRVGPFLVKERATYYFGLDRPPEEGITGVRRDDGKLYRLQELARFDAPDYPTPVLLHSRGVIVYKLELIP
ncbi:MAG: hypothetical protein A2V67_17650 [Deltaproteobacteria bacterium RBG_13_61_14]|nr:MAG: hypothetical protein A2V67_17650 [Deltaproteobacteria bacterium RBG_13_61_14]